jgi:hypothetical protein
MYGNRGQKTKVLMEFQGDSATFAAKLKKGVQDILEPLFLEN